MGGREHLSKLMAVVLPIFLGLSILSFYIYNMKSSPWVYEEEGDKMRDDLYVTGTIYSKMAYAESDPVDPGRRDRLTLSVAYFKSDKRWHVIMLGGRGSFGNCTQGCSFDARFGNGPVESFTYQTQAPAHFDIYLPKPNLFVERLTKNKKYIIELKLRGDPVQFEFEASSQLDINRFH